MSRASPVEHTPIHTNAIIPHPNPKLLRVIPDFNLDPARPRVPESIAQRFSRYPIDFIPQDRMEVLRRALHFHRKSRRLLILNCSVLGHLLPERFNGCCQAVGVTRGPAETLNCIACIGNCLRGVVKRRFQYLPGIRSAAREEIVDCLKAEQHSLKALQQRIVEIAGDAQPLVHAPLQSRAEFP